MRDKFVLSIISLKYRGYSQTLKRFQRSFTGKDCGESQLSADQNIPQFPVIVCSVQCRK
jgi:hypothetical protein